MNATKADKLTSIALSVFKLNGQLIEWGNHFSLRHGLTSARWQVLGAISIAPQPPNIPQIAATMGVTRQGVLKQINLLVDEGIIQPQPNPTHKRSPLYTLTKKGQANYEALAERWETHVREIAAGFSAADLDAAIRVLSAMSQVHGPGAEDWPVSITLTDRTPRVSH
ncbi:MarR family winged helix-turn-helix transcriptional regulator [Microvirgula aerodenitrificans]|uniref:MarR family winged helix-turn-helix transcriptional regulator n=1 Tax=Microvirgula aerodenitrificans TaxID=57480 RepID=UPI000683D8D5|nr:MarR family winged helix-turn-helix transcriptional regulator [Microvirgula aerodenitrificans]